MSTNKTCVLTSPCPMFYYLGSVVAWHAAWLFLLFVAVGGGGILLHDRLMK